MVSCNVGLTSALTSLYLFQMPRLGSDIQNLSTGIGLTPSPTRCNIRSDLTVSVIAFSYALRPFIIRISQKNVKTSMGKSISFLLDPRTVSSDLEAIGSHRRLQHGSCRASVCPCAEVIPAAADLMPSGIHIALGSIGIRMQIIPMSAFVQPPCLHIAVGVEIVPAGSAVPY